MKIYFTSDLHFGHKKILEFSPAFRAYSDVDEMNANLIKIWNDTVSSDDVVYNLGDFSMFSNINRIINIAKELNGHHILILGNHDFVIKKNKERLLKEFKKDGHPLFDEIVDYKKIELAENKIILSHYPMNSWDAQQYGSIMLHGHLHDYISNVKGKIVNVGYDLHGKLLSIDEVLEYTNELPTLPYRDVNNEFNIELKNSNNVFARKELIKKRLALLNKI